MAQIVSAADALGLVDVQIDAEGTSGNRFQFFCHVVHRRADVGFRLQRRLGFVARAPRFPGEANEIGDMNVVFFGKF